MSLAPRLDLRQSQSLVMTPQLQQAIRLLALSNLEIEGFLAEEIERNPLQGGDTGEASLDVDFTAESFHHDSVADQPGSAGMDGALGLNGAASGGAGSEDGPDLDAFATTALSLSDHLLAQAGTAVDGPDLFIAAHLIDQIDESGYLTAPLTEIAMRLGVPVTQVEAVLATIQTFDPTGVGARDLAECLALQAREADRYDPCIEKLLDHLDLLARGDLSRLRRICQVDEEDLADMIHELRGYDPKPGLRFGGEPSQPVVPDLYVARRKDGWGIEINAATLPRVLVNRTYYVELSAGKNDKASKAWLGLYELKYFFTSAIQSSDGGDAVSAQAVKSAIKALIAGEGDAILSDDTLVEQLKAKGFDIARRTVAKYREALGIGSSVQRRRARALGAG
jgi:RNA polymerase sigma-54 factor